MKTTDRDEAPPVDEMILKVKNSLMEYGQLPEQEPDKTEIETLEVL